MILNPIHVQPLKPDDDEKVHFDRVLDVFKDVILETTPGMKFAGALAFDEKGKPSLVLCILNTEADTPEMTAIAVLVPSVGAGEQVEYARAFNTSLLRSLEAEAIRRMDQAQAAKRDADKLLHPDE